MSPMTPTKAAAPQAKDFRAEILAAIASHEEAKAKHAEAKVELDAVIAIHDARIASLKAALADPGWSIEISAALIASVVAPTAPIARSTDTAVAPASAPIAAPAPKTRAMTSTERSHRRRAELAELNLPAKWPGNRPGSSKDARAALRLALDGRADTEIATLTGLVLRDVRAIMNSPARAAAAVGCNGATGCNGARSVAPVAPPSSNFLNLNNNDDDDDSRARRCNEKSVAPLESVAPSESVVTFPSAADQTERLVVDVERALKDNVKFPLSIASIDRKDLAIHLDRLVNGGISPQFIRETIPIVAQRAGPMSRAGAHIERSIRNAYAENSARETQPTLPFSPTPQRGYKGHGRRNSTPAAGKPAELPPAPTDPAFVPIFSRLETELGAAVARTWFGNDTVRLVGIEGDMASVSVVKPSAKQWIEGHYEGSLVRAIAQVHPGVTWVRLVVDAAGASPISVPPIAKAG